MKITQHRPFLLVCAALVIIAAAWSFVIFHPSSANQTLDQRTRAVASQLKCPICQGESVADSPSYLAQEMRRSIHDQLQAGRSEPQVIQYFEDRYGSQIVWSPPKQGFDLLAWIVPIGLLLLGLLLVVLVMQDWRTGGTISEEADEQARPERLTMEGSEEKANASELDSYRQQLEEELAAEDALFRDRDPDQARKQRGQVRSDPGSLQAGTEIL